MELKKKHIIGRREFVSLPAFDLGKIEAKIDTGAYTSSIHCDKITVNGNRVTCIFLDETHPDYSGEEYSFDILKQVVVKSSNGQEENRVMIDSEIVIFGVRYKIKLTLTDRSSMKYPLLIGRKFLKDKFLVDVTQIHQNELK